MCMSGYNQGQAFFPKLMGGHCVCDPLVALSLDVRGGLNVVVY